jgi:quercetin dioxygenase-like cupin family protein
MAAYAVAAVAVSVYAGLQAQQPAASAVQRRVVVKQDMDIPDKEAVMAHVEISPGGAEGRHTHPAEVFAFVEQGTLTLFLEGKGTATFKAGDAFTIPRDTVHEGINKGSEPVRLDAVFIADKGKPLTNQVQ